MIHEEIVTYEVAKLAKEKWFREKCIEHYYDDTKDLYRSSNPQCYNFGGNTSDAPTQALLQRWLREKQALHIQITLWEKGWYYDIWPFEYYEEEKEYSAKMLRQSPDFPTYELALEDGLKYALENLI